MAAVLALAIGSPLSAYADEIFTFNASNINGYQSGSFGTVTLTDGTDSNGVAAGSVKVSVALAPNVFANTGASEMLEFSLAGSPSSSDLSITRLQFSGPGATDSSYTLTTDPGDPQHFGFGIGLNCTHCGNGTSLPYNALSFVIAYSQHTLSDSSFVANSGTKNVPSIYYFAADIGIPQSNGTYSTGYTTAGAGVCTGSGCDIGGGGSGVVPEPASLAVLATGLIGLGLARRRSRRS